MKFLKRSISFFQIQNFNFTDFNPENAKDCNQETLFSQHLLVCALLEMGNLLLGLGTVAQNLISDQSLSKFPKIFYYFTFSIKFKLNITFRSSRNCLCCSRTPLSSSKISRCVVSSLHLRCSSKSEYSFN